MTTDTQHPFRRSNLLIVLGRISTIVGCVLLSLPQHAMAAAGFTISPPSVQYTATVGGPNVTAGVTITNTTSATLTVSWQDNISWLVSTSGDTVSIPPGGSKSITHGASTITLWPGTFSGVATVTGGGVTQQIPVNITVTKGGSPAAITPSPAIGLSQSRLTFAGTVGNSNPINQAVTVSNTGSGTLAWTATKNAVWLTLTPASGTNSGTVAASVNLAGLAAGTYSSTITVAANGAASKTLPVSLTVSPAATTTSPVIGLGQASLAFAGTAGGANPTGQAVTVSNTGTGTLTWTATDNAAWLTLTPASGTNSGTLAANVNLVGLAAGTYSSTITVAANGAASKMIPVSLTVSPASTTTSPVIGLGQTSLAFTGTAGGANPAIQSVTVANTGTGTLTWTASDNAAWLTLTPASGTNNGALAASVNLTGLAAGTYSGTITVAANGAASKTLPVSLTVNTATTSTSSATLSWVLNKETDLSGYKVYVGTKSGVYNPPIDVGKVSTYQVSNLSKGNTYFFAITAYDNAGNESTHSAEVSKSIF